MASLQAVAVQHPGDDVVPRDQGQRANGLNDVGRRAGALSASSARQPVFSVGSPDPVQSQHDLGGAVVNVGHRLVDEGPHDTLLQPGVSGRGRPDGLEVSRHRVEGDRRLDRRRRGGVVLGDARPAGGRPGQSAVPARLQLASDEAVLRIGGVVLPEGALGGIAGRLEVAHHGLTRVVPLDGGLRLRSLRRFHGGGLHHAQKSGLDRVVDPQAAEGDAARLAIVAPTANTGVARDLAFGAGVLDGEFATTTATTQQTGQERRAVLGRAPRSGRNVLAYHHPDRSARSQST